MTITSLEQLRSLYDYPSGRAKIKQLDALEKHALNFIRTSPFLVMATYDKNGNVDNSPRGGSPGFVSVLNDRQFLIPDFKGNNRIDSLINILETGRIGMLFLIPGIDETLRINGSAELTTSQNYLDKYSKEKNPPKSCILVTIEEVFLHCAKALMRSGLWQEELKIDRKDFPTMGQMLKDQLGGTETPESQEEMVKRYQKDL